LALKVVIFILFYVYLYILVFWQQFRKLLGIEGNQESLGVGMSTRLLAGGGAGITAASLTYPLDLVRTRLAAQASNLNTLMRI